MAGVAIYFDHAATAPMRPEAIAAYAEAAGSGPVNPSSPHGHGRGAKARVAAARDSLAQLLGCEPDELVFTGSGTESDNMALFGAAHAQREKHGRRGIVTSAVEHHAVLNTCRRLAAQGFALTVLPVDRTGRVSPADAAAAIGADTAVVSVMAANNETGALQPVAQVGDIARSRGALMHVDAVQALGSVPLRLDALPADLLSVSAHKIGGPQGVGLLYVRRGTSVAPLVYGGAQERGRRAGTENVGGIAAFAVAAQLAAAGRDSLSAAAESVREALLAGLAAEIGADSFVVNGHETERLPHIANISFPGIAAETMLMNLDLGGVSVSGGAACASGSLKPSHVLTAMGLPEQIVSSAVRFSFGLGNNREEAQTAAKLIATIFARLRK